MCSVFSVEDDVASAVVTIRIIVNMGRKYFVQV